MIANRFFKKNGFFYDDKTKRFLGLNNGLLPHLWVKGF